MAYLPIEHHAIIGDLNTVALVGINGVIDFMCYPHFDSPTIFASLLDEDKGGHFAIEPLLDNAREKQLYLPDTNVLLTRFLATEGVAEISDFMPVEELGPAHTLVRRIKTVRGRIRFHMTCAPRFDYGRATHRLTQSDDYSLQFVSDGAQALALRLRSNVVLQIQNHDGHAEFTLEQGESAYFILDEPAHSHAPNDAGSDYVTAAFKETVNYWRRWVGQSNYKGRWQDMVNRSALTLKLMTSWRYGSAIAAATFGLPEHVGGERNWDYRYTWIRDASFTLYALIRLGYTEEAGAFMKWIEERCGEDPGGAPLQVMYGIDGATELTEHILDHFSGYRVSRPVRIGNGAYNQLQLDIYGELMDSVYLYNKYGKPIHHDLWINLVPMIDWVCENWQRSDDGIWEIRGSQHEFLYSRLMCWVAVDRGIRLATKRSFPAPLKRWTSVRDAVYEDIYANFWNEERHAFVQYKDAVVTDAAALLMPLVKFISPDDPRWLSTLQAIEDDLVEDSLVYRYRNDRAAADGLSGEEGTFSICTFWYVECLARAGDIDQARFVFEKMIGYANHVGLFAEQIGKSGEHLGNFPQAFTHLALISAAFGINRRLSEAGWRA